MALPYSTPPGSVPGTPLTRSRPPSPSRLAKAITSTLSTLKHLQEGDNSSAVLEKQHLATSRSNGSTSIPRPLRPFITLLPLKLPSTTQVIYIPVPTLLRKHEKPTISRLHGKDTRRSKAKSFHLPYRPTLLGYLLILFLCFFLGSKAKRHSHRLKIPFVQMSTNILSDEQIARVWQWEIARGHYPSSRRTPTSVHLAGIGNPGVDASTWDYHPLANESRPLHLPKGPSRFPAGFVASEGLQPIGNKRDYLNLANTQKSPKSRSPTYPPRPIPDSILDLDIVMDHCDFAANRYVRDCLEVLRTGAQLNAHNHVRRGSLDNWRHIYTEDRQAVSASDSPTSSAPHTDAQDILAGLGYLQKDPHSLTPPEALAYQVSRPSLPSSASDIRPPNLKARQNIVGFGASARPHHTHPSADPMCDPDYPKIFHIFWAGPFTDKPYLAVMSFLFTQNLGLQFAADSDEFRNLLKKVCRPQLWIWINPGPAASLPNPKARTQMFDELRSNAWSAPFLHERFAEAVKFRLWNTTEQLDNIPELREHWRTLPLFNSGGVKYGGQPQGTTESTVTEASANTSPISAENEVVDEKREEEAGRFGEEALEADEALAVEGAALNATAAPQSTSQLPPGITSPSKRKKKQDEMLERVGSTSSKGYDRLTVVLSDMARFVLTHRYGGVYLDADTIFLRDWEELWGWKGAFAYRWSRLEKYNTAVLKMHRNSAIGSFLIKSALANGLDFHPMTISKYTKDAKLEGLLLRLPDALFDSAWLNTEYYQRDRPPFPYFKRFEDLFDPPKDESAAPLALGFDGFFRGAFSYHFHNFWWIPFDPVRNWPDLGHRFADGEKKARAKAIQAAKAVEQSTVPLRGIPTVSQKEASASVHPGASQLGKTMDRSRQPTTDYISAEDIRIDEDDVNDDVRDPSWATVLKRSFEAYIRGERPNMYGEWIRF